jgi:hypothetical protein
MQKHPKYLISSHLMEEDDRVESRLLYKTDHSSHLGCKRCLELCSHDREVFSQSRSQRSLPLPSHKPSCLPFFLFSCKFVEFCEFCCLLDESSLLCSLTDTELHGKFHWNYSWDWLMAIIWCDCHSWEIPTYCVLGVNWDSRANP